MFFPYDTLCKYWGRSVLYMCIEYHIQINMYHMSAQGVDERTIKNIIIIIIIILRVPNRTHTLKSQE